MTVFDRVLALMVVLLLVVAVLRWLLRWFGPRLPDDRQGEPELVTLQLTLQLEALPILAQQMQTQQIPASPTDAPPAPSIRSANEVAPIAHPYPPGRRIG